MCGVPPLSGLVWVVVGCERVVDALSLFFVCCDPVVHLGEVI